MVEESKEKKEAAKAREAEDQAKRALKASFFDLENLVRMIDSNNGDAYSYKETLSQAGEEFSRSIEKWRAAQQKASLAVARLLGHDSLPGETPASLAGDADPPWEEIEKYKQDQAKDDADAQRG